MQCSLPEFSAGHRAWKTPKWSWSSYRKCLLLKMSPLTTGWRFRHTVWSSRKVGPWKNTVKKHRKLPAHPRITYVSVLHIGRNFITPTYREIDRNSPATGLTTSLRIKEERLMDEEMEWELEDRYQPGKHARERQIMAATNYYRKCGHNRGQGIGEGCWSDFRASIMRDMEEVICTDIFQTAKKRNKCRWTPQCQR